MNGDPQALFIINTDTAGPVYLKIQSYADYKGNIKNWGEATVYDKLILGGNASAYYLPSESAKYAGKKPANATILSLCGIYVLPYYGYMGDKSLQLTDTVIIGNTLNEEGLPEPYKVLYYSDLEGVSLPGMYEDFEKDYSDFVYEQYLSIDAETLAFMNEIIEAQGFDRNNIDIAAVTNYIKNAVYYNMDYDVALDSESNVVISFLRDYKEGVCSHYASAATMLFRALGIPARYTVGFAGVVEDINTPVSIYGNRAHAWVEIYLDGFGWVCVEATGSLKKIDDKPPDINDPGTFDPPVNPGQNNPDGPILGKLPDVGNEGGGGGGGGNGGGGNGGGGGGGGSLGGGAPEGEPEPIFNINSSTGGNIYLKEQSFGNYTGVSFEDAPEYSEKLLGGRSSYYLVSYALKNGMLDVSNISIDPLAGIFALPYYTQSGGGIQGSDIIMSGDASSPYNVKYYAWSGNSGVVLPEEYRSYELAYRQFVKNNYLEIDTETDEFMKELTASLGFDASDPNIIYKVANYSQNAATYKLKYNPELNNESNMVVAFLSEYKEGLCRHYAASATMMFRSLGIPARYTVGFVAQGVKPNQDPVVDSHMGHAWVEVYVDGIGWIMVEVTGSSNEEDDDEEKPIEIKGIAPAYVSRKYEEGMVLNHTGVLTASPGYSLDVLTKKGYSYEVTISGTLTSPGVTKTTITEFLIYDDKGELVYRKSTEFGSDKFKLTFLDGSMKMYLDILNFSSESCIKEQMYNGTELKVDESDCVFISGTLADGYSYEIKPEGKISNAGKVSAKFDVIIYNSAGEVSTDHYEIIRKYGSLTVTPKPIEITAKSAEKVFDGRPLVCEEIEYDKSLLVEGEYVRESEVEGSQKSIGQSANVIRSVVIVDAEGKVTTGNYEITVKDGTLTVKKP